MKEPIQQPESRTDIPAPMNSVYSRYKKRFFGYFLERYGNPDAERGDIGHLHP